jgi:hypothetical protein
MALISTSISSDSLLYERRLRFVESQNREGLSGALCQPDTIAKLPLASPLPEVADPVPVAGSTTC